MALEPTQVLRRPLITEKSTWEGTSRNRYSFEVPMAVRKPEIKRAIEKIYNVRVERVSTQIRKGRERRTKFGLTHTGNWKKATVQLHPDDKIELF